MNKKIVVQALAALFILAVGLAAARWLISNPPRAERKQTEPSLPLVRVMEAEPVSYRVDVSAMGTVVASREVALYPEVTGRIIEQSPRLVPGGLFREGETILRIDARDYRIAVKQQEAALENARLELKLEKGRKVIAEREWKLLADEIPATAENRALALREPQQKSAAVSLEAAEAALELAELNLERTAIRAPFNAIVQEELVDVGLRVSPQTRLATLIGTDSFWVQVSVPVDRLRWIVFPRDGEPSPLDVRITQELGPDDRIELKGRLLRLLGDLDPAGRMARVLVSVEDPLGLKDGPGQERPGLMLGAYVRVEIQGKRLRDVFVLPRTAVREGARVWILDPEDRLRFRDVKILWRTEDEVVISQGLTKGERVVLTRLASPVPGMSLQVRKEPAENAQKKNTPETVLEGGEPIADG